MNEKIKKQTNKSSYIIELDAFKDGIKNGLTSKEIIEEFKKQNINNPWTRKPFKESAIRRLINDKYGGYKNYIIEHLNKTNL